MRMVWLVFSLVVCIAFGSVHVQSQSPITFEIVPDVSFESGLSCGWERYGSRHVINITTARAHTGQRSVRFGGPESGRAEIGAFNGLLPIFIPPTAQAAVLEFYYYTYTQRNVIGDGQTCEIFNADRTRVYQTIFRGRFNDRVWKRSVIDLMPFRGEVILFDFYISQLINNTKTIVYVDDVSVKITDAPKPNGSLVLMPAPDPVPRRVNGQIFTWTVFVHVSNQSDRPIAFNSFSYDLLSPSGQVLQTVNYDLGQIAAIFFHCETPNLVIQPRATLLGTISDFSLPNGLPGGMIRFHVPGADPVTLRLVGGQ